MIFQNKENNNRKVPKVHPYDAFLYVELEVDDFQKKNSKNKKKIRKNCMLCLSFHACISIVVVMNQLK